MAEVLHTNSRLLPVLMLVLSVIAVVLSAVLTVHAGSEQTVEDLTAEQLHQLRQGEVIVAVNQAEGPVRGTVEAIIMIDAQAELIWRIMNDCSEIPTYVPGVKKCEVLDAGENWESIRHEVKWIWLFPRLSYVFRADYQPQREIRFKRTSGDLREMEGSWHLIPIKSRGTLVRYRVYLDPGFLIPQWLVRSALKSDLPAVLRALRNKVDNIHNGQEK